MVINIAPTNVIEIGSFLGASSIWVASAMAEYERSNKLHCIDLFPSVHNNNEWAPGVSFRDPLGFLTENMKKCGFEEKVEIHQGDSKMVIPRIAKKINAPVEFAIIDGDHSIDGCLADLHLIEPSVATGGFILLKVKIAYGIAVRNHSSRIAG